LGKVLIGPEFERYSKWKPWRKFFPVILNEVKDLNYQNYFEILRYAQNDNFGDGILNQPEGARGAPCRKNWAKRSKGEKDAWD
jgi:hypothetical protein